MIKTKREMREVRMGGHKPFEFICNKHDASSSPLIVWVNDTATVANETLLVIWPSA